MDAKNSIGRVSEEINQNMKNETPNTPNNIPASERAAWIQVSNNFCFSKESLHGLVLKKESYLQSLSHKQTGYSVISR